MNNNTGFSLEVHAQLLNQLPVGITVINLSGEILYYNPYCERYVDRKPEYIGRNIRSCHKKDKSIKKIERIISRIRQGEIAEYYYESLRNGKKLGVTIAPFMQGRELAGFIQSFVILK